jgi:predicted Zn-dependent peptidase
MQVADFEKATPGPGLDLYVHPTKKFKTILIQVYVHQVLGDEVTSLALLPFVQRRGCRRFPNQRKIVMFLEDLYGASLSVDVLKVGERQILYFRMEVVNDRYAPQKIEGLRKSIGFLSDLISRPVLEKEHFRKDYVQQEKVNLDRLIHSLVNDRMSYATERCLQELCPGEPYSIYEYGRREEISKITPATLTRLHERVMREAPIEIFIVGDVRLEETADIVGKAFRLPDRDPKPLPPTCVSGGNGKKAREIIETMDVDQGKLVMGGRTGVTWNDPDIFPLTYYNGIFGGFAHSKLFVNVRERDGMAYSAGSSLDNTKGLLLISAGIDASKYQDCIRVIQEEMSDMAEGKFSRDAFDKTRSLLIDRIHSREDSPSSRIGSFAEMLQNGNPLSTEEILREISRVTPDDVVRVSSRVHLSTIYFLQKES